MPRLTGPQIRAALPSVSEWRQRGAGLERVYACADFVAAMRFVNRVARLAERAGHHPDLEIRWNRVKLSLTTHDEGGLTEKDFQLARQCDRAFQAGRRVPRGDRRG